MATWKKDRFAPASEAVAMRFDPQIKYITELVSRQERRSLTSLVEWAIDKVLRETVLNVSGKPITADAAKDLLWDVDVVERIRKLAERCPNLLNYEERRLLSLIKDFSTEGTKPLRFAKGDEVDWSLVKACWDQLSAYAMGQGSKEELSVALKAAIPSAKSVKQKQK